MTLIRKSWLSLFGRRRETPAQETAAASTDDSSPAQTLEVDIPNDDPLLAHLLSVSSVVEIDKLNLDSPTLNSLKAAGVKIVVPLVSQGELIGLLNLGPRRSEQEYSADDRRLLNTLAAQAAPALRVAQLARQQQAEARERERLAQELRVARVIQQTLLPKEIPSLPGWKMAAHWQPARAVSGDFYDFISFPDGRIAIIVGDVTDKGVPAALVMATTRSVLHSAAEQLVSPGEVLRHANNMLTPDMPNNMFVTCLYALLDPSTGVIRYANAGHNPAFQRTEQGVEELRARGMPLGLMEDMTYEEKEALLSPGDQVILYSDGLIEAHNHQGDMFGFPRLRRLLVETACHQELIPCLLSELAEFTGEGWEQEDDVTFVSLERKLDAAEPLPLTYAGHEQEGEVFRSLARFSLPSQPGNEREAMQRVVEAVRELDLPALRLERIKTAVAEATMNAMEHGNDFRADLVADIAVEASDRRLVVLIRDFGGSQEIPEAETPDLDAKLAGLQSPRGWGLFLIKNMVDEMEVHSDGVHHVMELVFNLDEGSEVEGGA